jgi:hypothetical protein
MAYSKSKAASSLGISKKEFEKRADNAGFDNTEDYWNSIGGNSAPIRQEIEKQILALDRQLDELPSQLLDEEERETLLNKAISQVQVWYDDKSADMESGLREGKIQSAEDQIVFLRETEQEISEQLAEYDLAESENEEEFINRISALTARTEDEVASKTVQWRDRIENLKFEQVQKNTLTSGGAGIERRKLEEKGTAEVDALKERSAEEATSLETSKKYNLEQIKLARESSQKRRIQSIGTPEETEAQKAAARDTLDLKAGESLGSRAEIEAGRTGRDVSPLKNAAQRRKDLETDRLERVESRRGELISDESAIKKREYDAKLRKLTTAKNSTVRKFTNYGGSY